MLAPKRVKHRKQQRGRRRGIALRGATVAFGKFGLQALEPHWVTNRQIEAARVAITREVKRGVEAVHLTPIEYRLLAALIKGHGRVMTHHQLLMAVWGPNAAGRDHYLRIYMGNLRQKLEADPAQPQHLLTELGVCYRLVGLA